MKVKENCHKDGSHRDHDTRQAFDTANTIEEATKITVAIHILIAMAAQALAYNDDIFVLTLCMEFVAHMATTPLTGKLIYEVRGFGDGPLVRVDLCATDIACLCLGHLHLLLGTGRVLLFGKMFLTEAVMTVGTTTECLFATLVTATRSMNGGRKAFDFGCVLHSGRYSPHW